MWQSQEKGYDMKKPLLWFLLTVVVVALALLIVGRHYVISSAELDEAIAREIPPGSSKPQVASFIQARHPVVYEDLGSEIKARVSGLAENMIYRKDVVIIFEFSPEGRLRSYSKRESLTFL
jgi:hypothetical protein